MIPANEAIMGKRLNDNRVNNTQKYTWLFNVRFTSDTFAYNFFTLINDIIPENPAQIEPIFSLNTLNHRLLGYEKIYSNLKLDLSIDLK